MAKKKKNKKKLKRMLFLGVSSIAIIIGTTYTIGKYWVEIYDKYQEKKELKKKLVTLKEKEDELKVDASKLQDPDYIARYAREKYSYSKDGEIILRIP
ncbi:MAG: septum formation initiator family protein [bacterium]|nr:septum formation initiator family protein [bacterium]